MLIYQGSKKEIKEAVAIANKLLSGHYGFYASVRNATFKNTNCKPRQIADAMLKIHLKYDVKVVEYRKWNPFSSEQAYFTPKKPLQINLNKWKHKGKSKHDFVATLCHEMTHLVDNQYMHLEFGHKFRNPDRQYSAPYKISYIARLLSEAYHK